MARSVILCLLLVVGITSAVVEGSAGRNLLQDNRGKLDGSGASTAGMSTTESNINKAIDSGKPPKPGDKPPQLAQVKPLPTAANKPPGQGPKSSQGTATQGAPENAQAATSATITTYAAGSKPAAQAAPTPGQVTKSITTGPKSMQGTGLAGAATNMQAATGAAINSAVDAIAAPKQVPGRAPPKP